MTVWTLSLRTTPPPAFNAEALRLDLFRRSTVAEIEKLELATRGAGCRIGDLFRVRCDRIAASPSDRVVVEGDLGRVSDLAALHSEGEFVVEGRAGDQLGREMTGGEVWVRGDAGDRLGSGMRGGTITVTGNVGAGVAGPHGSRAVGMRGGIIEVKGSAGDYAGHRMRRGVLVIAGNAGALLASQMIAGTFVVAGEVGKHAAYAMRRGTLVLPSLEIGGESRFTPPIEIRSPFQVILARSLRRWLSPTSAAAGLLASLEAEGTHSRRGDLAIGGQAEIFAPLR